MSSCRVEDSVQFKGESPEGESPGEAGSFCWWVMSQWIRKQSAPGDKAALAAAEPLLRYGEPVGSAGVAAVRQGALAGSLSSVRLPTTHSDNGLKGKRGYHWPRLDTAFGFVPWPTSGELWSHMKPSYSSSQQGRANPFWFWLRRGSYSLNLGLRFCFKHTQALQA